MDLTRREALATFAAVTAGLLLPDNGHAAPSPEIAVNALRRAHGLSPLSLEPHLQRAAEDQVNLMIRYDKLSHTLGPGLSLQARVRRAGFTGPAGENLSAGRKSLQAVLDAWMHSTGHRANLMLPQYRYFGLAWARTPAGKPSRYGIYWAMDFGI